MKRVLKQGIALLLCVCLVFVYSYKKPVKADAVAVGTGIVVGAVVVATVLTVVGIKSIQDNKSYNEECQDIWNHIDANIKSQISAIEVSGRVMLHLTGDAIKAIFNQACITIGQAAMYKALLDFMLKNGMLQYAQKTATTGGSWSSTLPFGADFDKVKDIGDFNNISWPSYGSGASTFVSDSGMKLILGDSSTATNPMVIQLTYGNLVLVGESAANAGSAEKNIISGTPAKLFIAHNVKTGWAVYLSLCVSWGSATWITNVSSINNDAASALYTGQDYFNPSLDKFLADGLSVMNTKIDDVISALNRWLDVHDGTNTKTGIGLDVGDSTSVRDRTSADTDTQTRTQQDVLGRDVSNTDDKTRDDTTNKDADKDKTGKQEKSSNFPNLNLPSSYIKKFPFCLPWDMYSCVQLFKADPVTPKFTVQFIKCKIFNQNIDQSITIDVGQFDKDGTIGNICRWFSRIITIIGLIFITRKLIWK